ncbi:MAG: hypothetical protein ABIG44_17120 [Planctomycetota bacterium]
MSEAKPVRRVKIKCARCGEAVLIDTHRIEEHLACATCGEAVDISAYPPLLEIWQQRQAKIETERAETEERNRRERAEREHIRREREKERHSRELAEEAERARQWQAKGPNSDARQRVADNYGRTAMSPGHSVPSYWAVRFSAGCLEVVGMLAIVIGVVVCCVALSGVSDTRGSSLLALLPGASALLSGLLTFGLAQLICCIRDIAINSYIAVSDKKET